MRKAIRNIARNADGLPARGLTALGAVALVVAFGLPASAQTVEPAPKPQAAAPAPAPKQEAAAPAPKPNLPPVNVTDDKPKQKPAQQRAMTQGPNREPIKIPVNASGCRTARQPGKPYFVEFRSRTAVSYGHTFVFYGRLGDGNRFASYRVAGLHPKGDDPSTYMQGMMVPVPSETGASWGDLDEQYLTARFCVALTEAEYRRLDAYIRNLQRTKTTWHATTYNCNAFAADIARSINLDAPNPNMYLPESFIKRMADLNPRNKPANPFASFGFQNGFQDQPAQAAPKQRATQRPRAAVTQ